MEIKGIIDEVETTLHEQISKTFKSSSSSLTDLMLKIGPAVTKSIKMYLKDERNWFVFTDDLLNEIGAGKPKAGLSSRSGLPPAKHVDFMRDSVFWKLLKSEKRKNNMLITTQIMESFDLEKEAFFIGGRWLVLCEHEISFLLGLRAGGKDAEEVPYMKEDLKMKFLKSKPKTKVASSEIPNFFKNLITSAKLESVKESECMKKSVLENILLNVQASEENRDSIKKLIYFFLLNFVIFPTSSLYARHMYFRYNVKDMEEVNWGRVIHKCLIHDVVLFKSGNNFSTPSFFPPLIEAWVCYRTNSVEDDQDQAPFEKTIEEDQDQAPYDLWLSKSPPLSLSRCVAKSLCTHCKEKEESLCKELGTTSAKKRKRTARTFHVKYDPLVQEAREKVGVQMLEFCLAHAKQTLEDEEQLVDFESDEDIIDAMKDAVFKDHVLQNWSWILLKSLAMASPEELSEKPSLVADKGKKKIGDDVGEASAEDDGETSAPEGGKEAPKESAKNPAAAKKTKPAQKGIKRMRDEDVGASVEERNIQDDVEVPKQGSENQAPAKKNAEKNKKQYAPGTRQSQRVASLPKSKN